MSGINLRLEPEIPAGGSFLPIRTRRFALRYGRAPSQRELAQLAQASDLTTRKSKEGALDAGQLHADWAGKLARSRASRSRRLRRRCGTPTPASPTRATRTSRKPCRTSWC